MIQLAFFLVFLFYAVSLHHRPEPHLRDLSMEREDIPVVAFICVGWGGSWSGEKSAGEDRGETRTMTPNHPPPPPPPLPQYPIHPSSQPSVSVATDIAVSEHRTRCLSIARGAQWPCAKLVPEDSKSASLYPLDLLYL